MEDLESLLRELFDVEDEVMVLDTGKRRIVFTSCCTSSYASYSS